MNPNLKNPVRFIPSSRDLFGSSGHSADHPGFLARVELKGRIRGLVEKIAAFVYYVRRVRITILNLCTPLKRRRDRLSI
jgi:hypothetical protein